jgi:hypothetical protein
VFASLAAGQVQRAVDTLDADLRSSAWQARHADLFDLIELDPRPGRRLRR